MHILVTDTILYMLQTNRAGITMSELDFFAVATELDDHATHQSPEHNVWAAAVLTYVDDVRAYHRWLVWPSSPRAGDRGEAWRDFKNPECPMLHRMCAHIGYDAEVLRDGIKQMLSGVRW